MPTRVPKVPIEGYVRCRCGELALEHVAWMTGGVCFQCFLAGNYGAVKQIEVAVRMRRVSIPIPRRPKDKNSSKGSADTRRIVDACKEKALRRVKHLFPDMYDLLYNEERVKAGLMPTVKQVPNGWWEDVVATYLARLPYAARDATPEPQGDPKRQ